MMKRKNLALDAVEVKLADDGRKFSGYASVFGGVDSYGDTIMPGAYKATLEGRQRPVEMRWNHFGPVIGKWTHIVEDEKGLYVEGELTPGHSVAEDAYALLKHGAVHGLSIGYRPVKAVSNETGGEDLQEIDLIEISVVERPADLAAQIGDVKSAIDEADAIKDFEALLRDAGGFSRSEACKFVASLKTVILRDAGPKESAVIADISEHVKAKLSAIIRGE
ncbi:HK97 family phage prohead protease [Marinobacter sp. NSM]|uniref:HK97 family phage prohead protease n=1 Tax=Marinobacter sp. NSM TaxID=3458004 RepID=UPI004035A9A3